MRERHIPRRYRHLRARRDRAGRRDRGADLPARRRLRLRDRRPLRRARSGAAVPAPSAPVTVTVRGYPPAVARKITGLQRVLDAPAFFSVAYGDIASSIYVALGIIALHA